MDVLVVGSGGREYELGRQMTLSSTVQRVYFAPGNGGTAALDKAENVKIGPTDVSSIVTFVKDKKIGLTILGPDAAVAAGVGNALREAGATVFGPTREAGKLESSKAFAADFMHRYDIPHPKSWSVHSLEEALELVEGKSPEQYVIKADGLAAGKGVVLPRTATEAEAVLREMFDGTKFDGAGKDTVVIQERLHGPELSAFAISDGNSFIMMPFSQDHKRLKDNDEGPNTGGMGVYAPVPATIVDVEQAKKIRWIAEQTIVRMREEGTPYQGALYIGLMLAEERDDDPVVIEYNARFGDPETEVLLPILSESGFDVAEMLLQAARGSVARVAELPSGSKSALTVALAAEGYPENPRQGDEIYGLDKDYEGVVVQHAGTRHEGGKWLTSGGRALYVTGFGKNANEAAAKAYAAIGEQGIHFKGMQYRKDIGHQARS